MHQALVMSRGQSACGVEIRVQRDFRIDDDHALAGPQHGQRGAGDLEQGLEPPAAAQAALGRLGRLEASGVGVVARRRRGLGLSIAGSGVAEGPAAVCGG